MNPKEYAFWSVAMGASERAAMARLVASARGVGVSDPFHVMTDAPIPGCECYDGMGLPEDSGFRWLAYLKAAVVKLPGRIMVYVDPWHRWYSRPGRMTGLCGRSPIHIPLEGPLADEGATEGCYGVSVAEAIEHLRRGGVTGDPRFARPAWVMVRRSAIDEVYTLAGDFRRRCREAGGEVRLGLALSYAMHMLCADPEAHLAEARRDLWLPLGALDLEERAVLESTVISVERSLRLLGLPSVVYVGRVPVLDRREGAVETARLSREDSEWANREGR
ncbi:MAG: hypothetical protein KF833_21590 [Verrucomicrobiae bacterium]|nr:hypothetical protein [Verrucomicrobiae bacterium]